MTLTVTASVTAGDTPRVQVNVSSSPSLTAALSLFRTHADGTVHRVLLPNNSNLIGSFVGLDYHAPFNQAVTYHAEAGGLVSAESSQQWVVSDSTWLIHASDPGLSVLVEKLIGPAAPVKYPTRASRLQVLNARLPSHRHDYPLGGATGTVVVKCESPESRALLLANRADDGAVLLNTPWPDGDVPGWMWVQPGDLEFSNPGGFRDFPFRYATLSYEETTQPDSDVRVRSFDEVEALFPGATFASMESVYATYDDSELDVRLP